MSEMVVWRKRHFKEWGSPSEAPRIRARGLLLEKDLGVSLDSALEA